MAEQSFPVIYFGPDCTDRAVIKRIEQLGAQGYRVVGVTYQRRMYDRPFLPHWNNIDLGYIEHGRYLRRMFILFRSFWRLFRQRDKFRNATFFMARNLDNAILALFARRVAGSSKPFVYEVLDIRAACLEPGPTGKIFRWMELFVLRRCKLLVVSSPAYIDAYFRPILDYSGPWFLLENKVPNDSGTQAAAQATSMQQGPRGTNGRWVIGWFGLLDCEESWTLLKILAIALPDRIEILMRGILVDIDREEFFQQVKALPNITFGGEYHDPDDLAAIFGSVDLVWDVDISGGDKNSQWLLSNKLYQAGYFLKPLLSLRDSTTGDFVSRHNVGWVIDRPIAENLVKFFSSLSVDEYIAKQRAVETAPRSLFVETDDIERLCGTICGRL